MSNKSIVSRFFGAIWRALDGLRKVLHLIVLLGLFIFLAAGLAPETVIVRNSTALMLAPQGQLVDQLSGDAFDLALARAQGVALRETLLADLLDAIRHASDDDRVKVLVLQLDGLRSAGLSKLQELADALLAFKQSGKPVIALGSSFDQAQYYLAAHADEIYMHPMGAVELFGYGRFLPYYKSALDKLYIDYNVWTAGEFKSFAEPYTRNDMSEEDEIASAAYLNALWRSYQDDVTAARQLDDGSLQRYADELVELLRDAGGDMAELAVDYGLVDALQTRDRMRARLQELTGSNEDLPEGYATIEHGDYLRAVRRVDLPEPGDAKIAVVVASGQILDGVQPRGTVGGDSTARLVRRAAEDEDVKALVLRVDSPGGSAFASDLILRELEVFQESGRPLVVSMGSVAASGGYWISMSADEIWASPTTLTGSIGVGATLPTFQRTLAELGINVDGIGTTALSGQFDVMQGLGDDAKALLGESVQYTYEAFIGKVAEYRGMSVEAADRVARGRVWVGTDAQERGLVDKLGNFEAALASSAELAGLIEGSYAVEYYDPELSIAEQLLLGLVSTAGPLIEAVGHEPRLPASMMRLIEAAQEPLAFLERFNDPRGLYAYCFCDVR